MKKEITSGVTEKKKERKEILSSKTGTTIWTEYETHFVFYLFTQNFDCLKIKTVFPTQFIEMKIST